ncbi:unnamed protein product [Malus baccata var. baccata]
MEFAVPPEFNLTPGGPPLWVSLEEKGYYGFKPTVCALCNSRTHDILQCPERKYFPDYVQEYIYMGNDSKWNWYNPHSEFYTQSLKEHLGKYFEQFNVPQELSVKDKLSKLLELTELYIEVTNQEFQIQPLINCGKSFDDQEEIGAETKEQSASQSCPREETPPADRETISPQSFPPQVYVPPEPFPTGLHECTRIDMLEAVHSKSVHQTSHDQLLTTLTILDSEQQTTDQKTLVVELDTQTSQFIKFKENQDQFRDSQIPHREILPVQRLWVLNTRFKAARWKHKPHWKQPYLITKIHSHRTALMKNSTTDKQQLIPYLLLSYDAIKKWLTRREQVT